MCEVFFKRKKDFTRIYYATDLHGSDKCFLKFTKAATIYKADVLILGGDITGKQVIPILKQSDNLFTAQFLGREWKLRSEEEVREIEKTIRDSGCYSYRTTPREMEEINADPSRINEVFTQLTSETLRRWIKIAEERLKDTDIKLFMTGGNDDDFFIESILEESDFIINPEGKVVNIDEHHEMISTGYSNITPWKCPRDIPESELAEKIETMTSQVKNMKNCIFNFHCPPIDSQIDTAPKLDATSTPPKFITKAGQIIMYGAGSTAVRNSIEKYQPLLGLHGHIHESRGFNYIGKTFCINPGSEYGEGILRGCLVNVGKEKVKGFQFLSG